jgi:hypothetical protein
MTRVVLRSAVLIVSLCAIALVLAAAVRTVRGARTADGFERLALTEAARFSSHAAPYVNEPTTVDPPMPGLPFTVATLLSGERPRLWHLRAIALFATVALGVLVLAIVQLETGSWVLGAAAAALALLGGALFGPPPGEARPVALALVLVLLSATALRHSVGTLGAILAALPAALSWAVDPQSLWALGALVVASAMIDARRACWFGLATAALVAGGHLALWQTLGPWFNYAAWDAAWSGWRADPEAALQFVTGAVLGRFGLCALGVVLSCAMVARPWTGRRGVWAMLAFGTLVGALASTQRVGDDGTLFVPCIVLVSVLGALSLQRVAQHLSASFDSDERDGESVVMAGIALQFLVLASMAASAPWVPPLLARLRV